MLKNNFMNRILPLFFILILIGFQVQALEVVAEFDPELIGELEYQFNNTSSVDDPDATVQYAWDIDGGDKFSDEESPTYLFTEEGSYNVCLSVQAFTQTGQFDSDVACKTVEAKKDIKCLSKFGFNNDALVASFEDASIGAVISRLWDFGDGGLADDIKDPVHEYAEEGEYKVCLTIETEDQCKDVTCKDIVIKIGDGGCLAKFEYTLINKTVSFKNQSLGLPPMEYTWDLGDGSIENKTNVSHTYAEEIVYVVCLTVLDANQCEHQHCENVDIGAEVECEAGFFYNEVAGNKFFFVDDSEGDVSDRQWDFGDGTTATSSTYPKEYDKEGTFTVCLKITTLQGCEDETCEDVLVGNVGCKAKFFYQVLSGNSVTLVAGDENGESYFKWDYGDGNTEEGIANNVNHKYDEKDTYKVCLTVSTDEGCEDTTCDYINIGGPAKCDVLFTYSKDAEELNKFFFTDATISDMDVVEWAWDFGDGNTSDKENPNHYYEGEGDYEVCLDIVTENGCEGQYCEDVISGPGPCWADWGKKVDGLTVTLIDGSYGTTKAEIWEWDFGDGTTSTEQSPVKTFDTQGDFKICLNVIMQDSCYDDKCLTVTVEDECEAKWFAEASGNLVQFVDESTAGTDVVAWEWDFGDGNTSDKQSPLHNYIEKDTYDVCLTITSSAGCETAKCDELGVGVGINNPTLNLDVNIAPNPVADQFAVQLNTDSGFSGNISIINANGKQIISENIETNQKGMTLKYNAQEWNTGVYFIYFSNDQGSYSQRFIKMN